MNPDNNQKKISRRDAMKFMGLGALAAAGALALPSCGNKNNNGDESVVKRTDKKGKNKVSLLGFGCMRYPTYLDEENKRVIDMEKSQKLVDYAIAHGINYFDTAYNYHRGTSEKATGELLRKYPRESYYLATKLPVWLVDSLDKAESLFQEQLDRLGMEYVDYYLVHALSSQKTFDDNFEQYGVYDYLQEEKAKGRIKRLGFSFHGSVELMQYLLDKHEWDFVQIQLNGVDWDKQQAGVVYKMLEERNIPVIVMEPLRGGALAKLTADAETILKDEHPEDTPAKWAFRYAGSFPGVLTILSGMTHMEHLVENIKTFSDFKPLSKREQTVLAQAYAEYLTAEQVPCTKCRYCMPCPSGVDIPLVFETYNKCVLESNVPNLDGARDEKFERKKRAFIQEYTTAVPAELNASKCISCELCMKHCPQHIEISTLMQKISEIAS